MHKYYTFVYTYIRMYTYGICILDVYIFQYLYIILKNQELMKNIKN